MFTPQEVREQSESFEKAVFGGYSVSAVDDFVGSLAEDYAALYKENAVLKSKMKVLVERLEEYRKQEDSLNKVMLSAQQSADELVQDAERKCAKMLSETEASLRERNVDLKRELAAEAERVSRAKKTAAAFIAEMENQVHQSLSQLERIRQMTIVPKASAKQPPLRSRSLRRSRILPPRSRNQSRSLCWSRRPRKRLTPAKLPVRSS